MSLPASSVRIAEIAALAAPLAGTLAYYPPGFAQPMHEHEESHFSIVMAGTFEETLPAASHTVFAGRTLVRPEGFRHGVSFGRHGALILVVEQNDNPPVPAPVTEPAPAWLREVREVLLADPRDASLTRLALDSGVHPVHLSRAFERHFGERPSVTRLRTMVAHALCLALAGEETLAASAHAAGFADQAHLTRAVTRLCGLPPGRIRQILS